ncbi:MAG TPA: hypothetical protein VJ579_01840 [Candidatus Paceibacterota bacterium]|nr:hypothetical protein [Candidatus Paceibacterota bacterium]
MNPVLSRLSALPVELRALIEADDVIYVIDEVSDKFEIPEGWRGEIVRATIRVLSGVMEPKEFIPFLMDELYLDQEEALHLALEINKRIFSAVKPQLASLHRIEDSKIARRLKVPHKPRQTQIIEESQLMSEPEMTVAPSADPAPAEQLAATIQYRESVPLEGSVPSPMTTHFAQVPLPQAAPKPPAAPVPHPLVEAPLQSPLNAKLGNMRADAYREPI